MNQETRHHSHSRSRSRSRSRGRSLEFSSVEIRSLEIPEAQIALIIGQKGAGLTRIARETKAKVNVPREQNAAGSRVLDVTGTAEQFEQVKAIVAQILAAADAPLAANNSGRFGGLRHSVKRGWDEHRAQQQMAPHMLHPGLPQQHHVVEPAMLPSMNQPVLQSSSQLQLQLQQQLQPQLQPVLPISTLAPLPSTWGIASQAHTAAQLQKVRLLIESERCGAIIGKAGSGLKALKEASGANFTMDRDAAFVNGYRLMTIEGSLETQSISISMICQKLGQKDPAGGRLEEIIHLKLLFPADKGGLVIGKGGSGLKLVCQECGVQLEAQREPIGSERLLGVQGSAEGVCAAVCFVLSKIANN
mmetsp:Transcript_69970/g.116201  ORF Transcript_69970/g.116201 Transcript_69970/m.116201 type:complete len:360 (+) Transcript_69970:11-1090(+)